MISNKMAKEEEALLEDVSAGELDIDTYLSEAGSIISRRLSLWTEFKQDIIKFGRK